MTANTASKIEDLRREFCKGAKETLGTIETAWEPYRKSRGGAGIAQALIQIQRIAHGLAGRGGTFGHDAVTTAAQPLEQMAIEALEAGEALSSGQCDNISGQIDELGTVIAALP